ncbi:temperature dependent protein affecting M2 dsRNA replication-domain-containing protein [Triangularia verruculosa]|uniref:Temperature dependent protein affecting M2 dsRNA replication-domain-containing protein n=1 Tax=Triangularia verruculosa TaxID=2587418 RepID=A0AAN6XPP8_9PEZI|nr:temperature dependent protein affecting M2 dsRNA replication-domain-containing protein [Triangularia verruculosa]
MPTLIEDPYINLQVTNYSIAEIADTGIAVDATYYLHVQLDSQPSEPLLSALGGVTGIQSRIEHDLDQWQANGVIPLFVFDGQNVKGQDEINIKRAEDGIKQTNKAWEQYFNGQADAAVASFGENTNAFHPHNFYRLLQGILKRRKLHFLVAPFNAASQIASLDMTDSDQVGGIMGSVELLMYPINDCVIRSIDWENKTVRAVSKEHLLRALNVTHDTFVDLMLMTGTSFLPVFPVLKDPGIIKNQPPSINDALNIFRVGQKNVAQVCNTFAENLKSKDPNWQDKYRKARMFVDHFIYINEKGEVGPHNDEDLTGDNYEYLALKLPREMFHYLNCGLIGPRILNPISHAFTQAQFAKKQTSASMEVLPTLDGTDPDEYKKLATQQTPPIKEAALSLVVAQLHRAFLHSTITMGVWFDREFKRKLWDFKNQGPYLDQWKSWRVAAGTVEKLFPDFDHGSIISEVLALQKPEFVASTFAQKDKKVKNLSPGLIKSMSIWRFLHIRGYVNDKHELTSWGKALGQALIALQPTVKKHFSVPHLYESVIVALELVRFDLLNAKNKHEALRGLPMNGTGDDQSSLLLISRCACLLKLRHESYGYTGPLSKSLLAFRSLASEVRAADRDLVEAILVTTFVTAQADRRRDDYWELGNSLPFYFNPDVSLGIAVKTYFDDIVPNDPEMAKKKQQFPSTYIPYAMAFSEDLEIACEFFKAIHAGIKVLPPNEISAADQSIWQKAEKYLEVRT